MKKLCTDEQHKHMSLEGQVTLLQAYLLPSTETVTPTQLVCHTASKLPAYTGAIRLQSDSLLKLK